MAFGKPLFSKSDWARTRIAFDLLEGTRRVVDIGIGQGQLVNLLVACLGMERVWGVDFQRHSKLLEPESAQFSFWRWDVTLPLEQPLPQADVAVAMEVLEHVDIAKVDGALARIRGLSRSGTVLITVPYREAPPLYHHDKPHGHKQSFDDARIEAVFGSRALVSNYAAKWYLVMLSDFLETHRTLTLEPFMETCRSIVRRAVAAP